MFNTYLRSFLIFHFFLIFLSLIIKFLASPFSVYITDRLLVKIARRFITKYRLVD